jgi:hypothetical protein
VESLFSPKLHLPSFAKMLAEENLSKNENEYFPRIKPSLERFKKTLEGREKDEEE